MKRQILTGCILMSFLLGRLVTFAQNRTDFQVWPGVSLKLDLPKKWAFTVQYRTRIIDNASYYKGSYIFTTAEYQLNKHFEAMKAYIIGIF